MSNNYQTSRIADIAIPIKDYQRPDLLVDQEKIKRYLKEVNAKAEAEEFKAGYRTFPYFIGRTRIIEKLKERLKTSPDKGAAYLLVGARGAGKTTVVNKAVQELKEEEEGGNKYRAIDISLSNENFEEIDIYRIIGKRFCEIFFHYNTGYISKSRFWGGAYTFSFFSSLLYLVSMGFRFFWHKWFVITNELNPFIPPLPIQNLLTLLALLLLLCCVLVYAYQRFQPASVLSIRYRAKRLLKRIESDITENESAGINGNGLPFKFSLQRTRKYPIADIRFIEHEIIMLLRAVNKRYRDQRFIFIFDELDKIEFKQNIISDERSYEKPEEENQTRRQQKAVIEILGNFKYFLNHAQAKFIFIAGREMNDASMADISKRDFYLRSIFDEIITLDSLLKEDLKTIDLRITSAVEAYIYGIILGEENFKKGDQQNLLDFKEYAKPKGTEKIKQPKFNSENDQLKELLKEIQVDDEVTLEEFSLRYIKKVYSDRSWLGKRDESKFNKARYASFLKDFILYLTFRSHGSPRLLFQYFEKYIEPCDKTRKDYRLHFSYKQQMVIGFVAHLYRGLMRNHYNTTVGNSDKLLANMPFIFDHVLKFHDFAFSWRSLELLPEVIDVNKSPNLRKHVRIVVQYLQQGYVKDISNGLFEYKFTRTASNEIRFISEISKTSRAAFNFTLDESLPLKQYYQQQIVKLKKDFAGDGTQKDYINSLGFFYMILGDLYFYDKEYDKAIENYDSLIQPFRHKSLDPDPEAKILRIRSHEFIIYIRGMLKVILTLERMKLYDSVFTYLETNNKNVVNYFNLPTRAHRLIKQPNPEDISRSSMFQLNNQLIFVDGFLNVLYVAEKASRQGVTQADLNLNVNRFNSITRISAESIFGDDQAWYFSMLRAHFHNQLGHLLFYKNGFLPGRWLKVRKPGQTFLLKKADKEDYADHYFYSVIKEFNINGGDDDKPLPKHYKIPISAYHEYYDSLANLLSDSFLNFDEPRGDNRPSVLKEVYLLRRYTEYLYTNQQLFPHNYQSKLFHQIGKYIAHFGNTILCFCEPGETGNLTILDLLESINTETRESVDKSGVLHIMPDTTQVPDLLTDKGCRFTLFTYLSGLYFKMINRQKDYAHSLSKILYLLKYNVVLHNHTLTWKQIETVYAKLVFKSLQASFYNCQYEDVSEFLEVDTAEKFRVKIKEQGLVSLSKYPDVKEVLIVFFELVIQSGSKSQEKGYKNMLQVIKEANWINSSTVTNHSFARTMELRYKVVFNELLSHCAKNTDDKMAILVDSLWCLRKVRTNLQVYGISYITNYYLRAEASYKIADLLKGLTTDQEKIVKEKLVSVYRITMDDNRMKEFLDPAYHKREALKNYRSCIQMHSQGECYYNTIRQMYYLEGDFDDSSAHFCATIDRYRINTGVISDRIDKCLS